MKGNRQGVNNLITLASEMMDNVGKKALSGESKLGARVVQCLCLPN